MKKVYLCLFACLLFGITKAQYCGNSGNSQCTPAVTNNSSPGINPPSDSLLPLVNCSTSPVILNFRKPDTINFGGQTLQVNWIRFDSIDNLPEGLCYSTNHANNTFDSTGCIKLSGNLCSPPGQYRLRLWRTAQIGRSNFSWGPTDNNLNYFIRVNNLGDMDTPVDTSQTDSNRFISYGSAPTCADCFTGINNAAIKKRITIFPNPFSSSFTIQLSSPPTTQTYFNLYDALGREVKREEIISETTTMQRNNLPSGIYFWQLQQGKILDRGKVVME